MARLLTAKGEEILVDAERLPELSRHAWHIDCHGYPRRTIYVQRDGKRHKTAEYLHRRVVGVAGQMVDHINGNRLDARRKNLRLVSCQANCRNVRWSKNATRGGFKGTYLAKRTRRWTAQIGAGATRNGRSMLIYLGSFATALDAAQAYDRAALFFFGEHAALNFPAQATRYQSEIVARAPGTEAIFRACERFGFERPVLEVSQ